MITAIDTNILLDILLPNPLFYESSVASLQNAADEGSLSLCEPVYGELCAHFETQKECDSFAVGLDIRVQPLTREAYFRASRAWRKYRQQGGTLSRILPDFLIGAHAETQAGCLLSRDRGFWESFPRFEGDRSFQVRETALTTSEWRQGRKPAGPRLSSAEAG